MKSKNSTNSWSRIQVSKKIFLVFNWIFKILIMIFFWTGGFPATESWLRRNKCIDANDRHAKAITVINAYMEFLNWDPQNEFPETMSMDEQRMQALAGRALRICCVASTVAIASSVPCIGQQTANRLALVKQIEILVENVSNDKWVYSPLNVCLLRTSNDFFMLKCRELAEIIENIWLQVKSVIVARLQEKNQELSADSENILKEQILSLAKKDAPVRQLMWKRLAAYIRLVKTGKTLPPVPPGYTDLSDELQSLATSFKRLTAYNYSVFGESCIDKLLDEISLPSTATESNSASTATVSTNEPVQTSNASTWTGDYFSCPIRNSSWSHSLRDKIYTHLCWNEISNFDFDSQLYFVKPLDKSNTWTFFSIL